MDQSVDRSNTGLAYIRETARKFLDRETSGGLLLIAATIFALVLGNSQWADAYHHYSIKCFRWYGCACPYFCSPKFRY